ncbi:protein TonB, links inner and outer membranes [Brevinema andersonii]|uniref:Protein TonB, links inner and outer membranes n=1 Tax=Brevinema andersonii TaxID=34097 RepID=A0A1I1ETB9_BREAD|nr:hypothetical protein [Brevinema andersonii]SFB90385.1 protein TonB, links inner and outer membranes [Brevinema andersonii]
MAKSIKPISLSYYIIGSIGIHAIVFGIFTLLSPLTKQTETYKIIAVNISTISSERSAPPIKQAQPIIPPVKKIVKKIQQKDLLPSPPKSDKKLTKSSPSTEPIEEKSTLPNSAIPEIIPENKQNDTITEKLDSILQKKEQTPNKKADDFLANASWIGKPRKTIAFPNISARISELQNIQGYGYSVTARITFTPQGWVSSVELIRASGDPRIDYIFRNELRKIRIEENKSGQVDTVIKTFNISVR